MSEPVTNAEIEDVLSSIRRLISDDKRPSKPESAAPVETREDTLEEVGEKLVLTPSFRVAEDSEPVDSDPTTTFDPQSPWEDPNATLFEAAEQIPIEEDEDIDVSDAIDLEADETFEAVTEEPLAVEPTLESEPDTTEAPVEALEPVVVLENPITDEEDLYAAPLELEKAEPEQVGEETPSDNAEVEATTDGFKAASAPEDSQVSLDQSVEERAETLSAKIEALEAAIGQVEDDWEPETAGDGDYAGTNVQALKWEDDTGAPEAVERSFEAVDDDRAETVAEEDVFATDEAILDEETLRELVADIVREELQGAFDQPHLSGPI